MRASLAAAGRASCRCSWSPLPPWSALERVLDPREPPRISRSWRSVSPLKTVPHDLSLPPSTRERTKRRDSISWTVQPRGVALSPARWAVRLPAWAASSPAIRRRRYVVRGGWSILPGSSPAGAIPACSVSGSVSGDHPDRSPRWRGPQPPHVEHEPRSRRLRGRAQIRPCRLQRDCTGAICNGPARPIPGGVSETVIRGRIRTWTGCQDMTRAPASGVAAPCQGIDRRTPGDVVGRRQWPRETRVTPRWERIASPTQGRR